ncbi:ATP-dependent helicase Lhr and Lhr-like helicase [Modicisalibacter ilicicola DSM 19980]|uniref:ATP-dependent helicase Lhr and Lhr-like helicase n=1 Tax=Modicisalibacter ilicicola DSM 19980 TaxID=1121942 RepID=A0A1M4W2T2_9GAMM|nr:DEAD/DEAH box helicase [Halomonas ilicicola]SHE75460.1 ATP-dependent helicase Lhr and Lhr-like helicase [Halomonas ilicicola DSM 19980]
MSAFDQLHPALQHHIVNSLGWPRLRPLQEATIEPVLRGENAILLAPTAGGKTEAACFPVLSRMLSEGWDGISVLYLCPIKALLNNLLPRLEYYAGLLGRRVALWHGDVSASRKAKIIADPPDILLTTPESLEAMLVSSRIDHRWLLGRVRSAIVDEVHAFAGDDRGWHLLSLVERIQGLAGQEVQRLGLSATVGNPEALCDWLAGGCQARRSVVNPLTEGAKSSDVQLDWVGSLKNAAIVISRLHRGEKRLVFVDSRSRVELLAMELRGLGVNTFVSHSSLSLEERKAAESAFAEGSNCVIVATSTLELGIDVGDLDRVIQVDAPFSVSSFLQRIGRTGRRADVARNCLFLATTEEAFLRSMGLLSLWRSGFVEPVEPPALPLHIYAQQIMALCLQERGIIEADIERWIGKMPGFKLIDAKQRSAVLHYMLETGILHSDSGLLSIGERGERTFGYQHFMELVSVFTTPPMVKVFHGKQELGEVHELTFAVGKEGSPALLTLGGRNWSTTYVDWPRRRAYVESTELRGRSQWLGSGQPMHFTLCQAIEGELLSEEIPEGYSKRAEVLLEQLREEFGWLEPGQTAVLIDSERNATWWTFAGAVFNAAMADALGDLADKVSSDNLAISLSKVVDMTRLKNRIRRLLVAEDDELVQVPLDAKFIQELKFSECIPQNLLDAELRGRYSCNTQLETIREARLDLINVV